MVYRGTYKGGVVILEGNVRLQEGQRVSVDVDTPAQAMSPAPNVWQKLLELAGACPDLPPDMAENHDYYLYGAPKRKKPE